MKRSLARLCSLALVLGMIVPGVSAEGTACPCCSATNVTWTNFTADTVPEPGVHYRLSGKVEKSGQWTLETAGTYCIDLAGQTLQTNSRAFIAGNNTKKPEVVLNLMDSSANQTGVIKSSGSTNSAWSAGVLYSCTGAEINLYGGTVTTTNVDTPSAGKGGVVTAQGNFNMYGGKIIGGAAQTYGGAISVQSSSVFTMTGGTIKSGTAPLAPCVYLGSNAKVILSGDAKVDNIYIDGTPKDRLTISGVYTGSVELAAKTEITTGIAVATADDADISGAEIDGDIIRLARENFGMPGDVNVAEYDGRAYLAVDDRKYDVIMVDAYQDITIPFQMSTVEFFTLVKEHLKPDGVMVVNLNMHSGDADSINAHLSDTIASVFTHVYTADVPYTTNRELFAWNGEVRALTDAYATVEDFRLAKKLAQVDEDLTPYEAVELLGMRVIDDLITEELAYYKKILDREGVGGLLQTLMS